MTKILRYLFSLLVIAALALTPVVDIRAAVMVDNYRYASSAACTMTQSVEEFTILIGTSATSNTATISSVDTSRTLIVWGGLSSNATTADPSVTSARVTLTNSTTVTAVRNTSDATDTVTVSGTAVQFNSCAVASVQYGTVSIAAASATGTAAISSITTTNSAVQFLGITSDGTSVDYGRTGARLNITSATQVTATRSTTTTANIVVGFAVVSFTSTVLNSNTQENTMSVTGTSDTNTITSVTVGQTWLVYGGTNGAFSGSSNGQYFVKTFLTNGTTITSTCQTSHAWAVTATVVEFKTAYIQSATRSQDVVSDAAALFEDVAISSVDTSKAFVSYLGETLTTGSSASLRLVRLYSNLTSATNKRYTRFTASTATTPTGSTEVIEFK